MKNYLTIQNVRTVTGKKTYRMVTIGMKSRTAKSTTPTMRSTPTRSTPEKRTAKSTMPTMIWHLLVAVKGKRVKSRVAIK